MKKIKSWLWIVIIIVAAIVFLWIIKTPIMSSYLSHKLKTKVGISSISIRPSRMVIKNFKIKNPRGNKSKYAFGAKKIEANYSFSKLFSSPSIVDRILVKDITLNIECKNPLCTRNNWTGILNAVHQKEQKKKGKNEVIISVLEFDNLDASVYGLGFKRTKNAHLDNIVFKNVNSRDGFPTQQLISALFRSAGLRDYLKGVVDPRGMLEKFSSPFTGQNTEEKSLENQTSN